MDRKLGHKLIDRLYNSGNLSLKECGDIFIILKKSF